MSLYLMHSKPLSSFAAADFLQFVGSHTHNSYTLSQAIRIRCIFGHYVIFVAHRFELQRCWQHDNSWKIMWPRISPTSWECYAVNNSLTASIITGVRYFGHNVHKYERFHVCEHLTHPSASAILCGSRIGKAVRKSLEMLIQDFPLDV